MLVLIWQNETLLQTLEGLDFVWMFKFLINNLKFSRYILYLEMNSSYLQLKTQQQQTVKEFHCDLT